MPAVSSTAVAATLSLLLLVVVPLVPGAAGQTMPVTFSCDARLLAMRFALELQPERGAAGLAEVAAGLGVQPDGSACIGQPPPSPSPPMPMEGN